jgi:hypothetical protein
MLAKQAEMKYHFFSMSRKAQAMIDQIDALPQRDKRELWEELGRRLEQSSEVESDPELEKALLEGITSGPLTPLTQADWEQLRANLKALRKKP